MTELIYNPTVSQTVALLTRYGFEMRGYTAQELINQWLKTYQARWVRLAVVEALYQGRYKAVSVEQILRLWFRRGNPLFHFTHEFEHLICRNLPRYFAPSLEACANRFNKNDVFVSFNESSSHSNEVHPTPCPYPDVPHLNENRYETAELTTESDQSFSVKETRWDLLTITEAMATSQKTTPHLHEANNQLDSEIEQTSTNGQPISSSFSDETNSQRSDSQRSIHQFIPLLDESELYVKLKAVAQQSIDKNSEV